MSDVRRRLTLADFDDASSAVTQQAVSAASGRRRLKLTDLEDASKAEEPFEGGSTLQVLNPVGENFDTGIPIGKTTAQVLAGAGKTYFDIGNRAKQIARVPGAQQEIDEAAVRDQPLMRTTPAILGSVLPYMAAGIPVANTARAAAAFGAGSGAMMPTTSDEGLGAEILNPMLGALGGAAGQKIANIATNTAGRIANALPTAAFNVLPRAAQNALNRRGIPKPEVPFEFPEDRTTVDLLNRQGVRSSIGDVDPRSMFRSFEDATEPLGLGRRGFLEGQQDDLKSMLESTRASINKPVRDQTTGQVVPDNVAMAQGIKDQYAANKKVARDMFDEVGKLAAQPGVLPIAPTNTYAVASQLMGEKPAYFKELQDNPLWRKLIGVERDSGPQTSIILQSNGAPFKKPQLLDFEEVKALRSALGSEWRDAEKPSAKRAYAKLLKSLDEDIDAWGSNTGNSKLNNAYSEARAYYKKNVVPYTDPTANPSKSPVFSNVALKDKVDSETLPRGLFKEDRGQLAQDFMDLSTPSGQQAGKNELINEIISAGLNPDTETGLSNAMIRHSAKYSAPGSAVFDAAEQASVKDATDALKHTRRAAQLGLTPPKTGFRAVPWAAGSALMGGTGVPLYYGLNAMMGDRLEPTERVAAAFVLAPLTAAGLARAGTKYTQSAAGKALHFADPNIRLPALGGLQKGLRNTGKGVGFSLEDQFRHGQLGHRATED